MGNKAARKYKRDDEERRRMNYREWQRPREGVDVDEWLGSGITIGSRKGI